MRCLFHFDYLITTCDSKEVLASGTSKVIMMMEQKPHFNDLHLEGYCCLVKVVIMLILIFSSQSLVNGWNHVMVICNVPRGNLKLHVTLCLEHLIFLLSIPKFVEVYGLLQFLAISLYFSWKLECLFLLIMVQALVVMDPYVVSNHF